MVGDDHPVPAPARAARITLVLDDTHPSLRERVEALGQRPLLPPPLTRSASVTLLGTLGDRLAEEFDRQWWADQAKDWSERYRHVTRSQARLRALDAADLASLPLHELQEVALLKAEFLSPDAAKPTLEHLLRQPGGPFPMASYVYGRILLNERRRDGLDYLAAAARHDKRLTQDALHAGYMYLLERMAKIARRHGARRSAKCSRRKPDPCRARTATATYYFPAIIKSS